MVKPHPGIWIPLFCLAPALGATEPTSSMRFGLQAAYASPHQDARNLAGPRGYGIGMFVEQDHPGNLTLRSRFDYLTFSKTPSGASVNQASLGAEVRYTPVPTHGFFMVGGLFGTRIETRATQPADENDPGGPSKEKTSFKIGLAAGAGYRVTDNTSFTLRYTTTSLDAIRWSTLEAGVEFRF